MTVRRRIIPVLAFLAAATWVSEARSQQRGPGNSDPLPGTITQDQVRRFLQGQDPGPNLPDLPPEFLEMLKNRMQQGGQPKVDDKQLKDAVDRLNNNPEVRKKLEELGKNWKQPGGGKNPFNEDQRKEIEKLLQQPPMNNGMPPIQPMPMPNGMPAVVPPMPMNNGMPPALPQPGQVPQPDPVRQLDPNGRNPLEGPRTPNEKAAQAAATLWERNIGPIDDTPGVKKAIFELIEGTDGLTDGDGKNFWDEFANSNEGGDGKSFLDMLEGTEGEGWTWPKLDMPEWKLFGDGNNNNGPDVNPGSERESWWKRNFNWNRTPSAPREPSTGSGGGINIGTLSLQGIFWPIIIIAGIIALLLILWKFRDVKWRRDKVIGLFGPGWPLDPRRITTREHVVIAFEYLSVLICGPSAKTWTHNTIAEALADLAKTQGERAVMLARLYELARYAPLDEPLTTAELAEARRLVCALAGLEYE